MLFGFLILPLIVLVMSVYRTRTPAQKAERAEAIHALRFPKPERFPYMNRRDPE